MCARDILFWINTFSWIYEPRTPADLPFITYEFQDDAILRINAALGHMDVGIDKSRDMGMSWICLNVFFWRWLFHPMQSFLLISRNEDLVDKADDTDSLFWKLDHIFERLPSWMRPMPRLAAPFRTRLKLFNPRNNSVINGTSTTSNAGRGGRRTGILADEHAAFSIDDGYAMLAATQAVTNTRIFLSTPQGAAGAYYDVMHDPAQSIIRIRAHWSEHPLKRPGLYTSKDGRLEILDRAYWAAWMSRDGKTYAAEDVGVTCHPQSEYEFIRDGKVRSPWYDNECRRCPIPTLIAQELDIDYLGSNNLAFDREVLQRAISRDARSPLLYGELDYDPETGENPEFRECGDGRIKLWTHLTAENRPPQDIEIVIGNDVSMGVVGKSGKGASNSVSNAYNRRTGTKIASLKLNGVNPYAFAKYVIAFAKWLGGSQSGGPLLIWEANGPGRQFGEEIVRLRYPRIYRESKKGGKFNEIPGWWSGREAKISLLGEYQRALATGECCNRDEGALRECECYVITATGAWEHYSSLARIDPTQSGKNHGDNAIADALAWRGCALKEPDKSRKPVALPGSLAYRRLERRKAAMAEKYW